jgi:carbamoyl-phosphate synthase large subunit
MDEPQVNVMLTSVGRRAYLVNYFKEALGGRGKVVAANSHMDSTGMLAADIVCVLPRPNEKGYIESLLEICRKHSVKLLMSLHDWEAPFIADHQQAFREVGTLAVVPEPRVTRMCLDKWLTFGYVKNAGWNTPASFLSLEAVNEALRRGQLQFPVLLKPRCGQGSICIEVAYDFQELSDYFRLLSAKLARMESNGLLMEDANAPLILQQYLPGRQYDLEIVNDLEGHYVSVLAKEKLASRAGECELALTVEEPRLTDLGRQIGMKIRHPGVLDVDVIEQDGTLHVLEFNPRFGGCYPFSHMAGANLPAAYVAWARGQQPDPSWLRVRPGARCFKDFAMVLDSRAWTGQAVA